MPSSRHFHITAVIVATMSALLISGPASTHASPQGRRGAPDADKVFTLPVMMDGGKPAMYYPNLQTRFPQVNWSTLQRLYIPAGHYDYLNLGNLPVRDASNPLIISNLGGQVRVCGLDTSGYCFVIGGGSNWVLTGRFDATDATGHANFRGHADGAYANSTGTYGIYIDDDFKRTDGSCLGIGGGATNFELEFIEAADCDFAGFSIKTDDNGSATMRNVKIHDVYVHDTGSEGLYIGSTQAQPQHTFENLEIYNNRILRTGTEAVQVGQQGNGLSIRSNVIGPSAIRWRSAFQQFQDGNIQLGYRYGRVDIRDNVVLGGGGAMIFLAPLNVSGDTRASSDLINISNNYFDGTRYLWGYTRDDDAQTAVRIYGNLFRGYNYTYRQVYAAHANFGALLSDASLYATRMTISNNKFDAPDAMRLIARVTDNNGNGLSSGGNISGSFNLRGLVVKYGFQNSGEMNVDAVNMIEFWTERATVVGANGPPVSYTAGALVTYKGQPYRCISTCASGVVPLGNAAVWQPLPYWPDDVRQISKGAYPGIGLLDTVPTNATPVPSVTLTPTAQPVPTSTPGPSPTRTPPLPGTPVSALPEKVFMPVVAR
jgi:hypothetical protein